MSVVGLSAVLAFSSFAAADDEWVSLFDGKTLNGWKVVGGENKFSVENGVIKGEGVPSTCGINTFLVTEKEHADFDFKVEFLIESGNSGVQFRSATRTKFDPKWDWNPFKEGLHKVFGYQAEITPDGSNTGRIYDEERRGYRNGIVFLDTGTPQERLAVAKASFRKGDWNEMRVRCEGVHVQTWLNGNPVADLYDEMSEKGMLGLQVHLQGPAKEGERFVPGVVRFRNPRIKELKGPKSTARFFRMDPAITAKCQNAGGTNNLVVLSQDDRTVVRLNGFEVYDSLPRHDTILIAPDVEHDLETRNHQGIPSVAVSPKNGRIWCTWYANPIGGENHLDYCVLSTSADGGRTWKEVLVADPDGEEAKRAFDPQVWVAPDGRLRWTWSERTLPNDVDRRKVWNAYEGKRWDTDVIRSVELDAENEPVPPYPAPLKLMKGVMMGKPIVVGSGDWVYPVCEWHQAPSSRFYTTRDGQTFSMVGGITLPQKLRSFDEENVVELKDGRWWSLLRGADGPYEAFSSDAGKTWSAPTASPIAGPSSRHCVRRLPSGNLLLIAHGKIGEKVGRTQLSAFVSDDEAKTWKGGLILSTRRGDVSYPDLDVDGDGNIHVVYDNARAWLMEVLMATFTEAEVLAGEVDEATRKARFDRSVSRPKKTAGRW